MGGHGIIYLFPHLWQGMCMAKKKKKKPQVHTLKRKPRLQKAKGWLAAYDGDEKKIIRKYRDKFLVDIATAVRDLQDIGYTFTPEYVYAVLQGEERRIRQMALKKQEQAMQDVDWRDDTFYFIAGYTSGGAPYGVTWKEMGLEPYQDESELFDEE